MSSFGPVNTVLQTGESVVLRSAVDADAASCLSLYRSVVEEGRLTLASEKEFSRTEEQERGEIRASLEGERSLWLVAAVGTGVVGMLRTEVGEAEAERHFCDTRDVRVRSEWRRRGIGSLLMETLISWAQSEPGIEKLGLFVFSTSTAARSLYERHGFVVEGVGVRDIKFGEDDYADTIVMGRFVT